MIYSTVYTHSGCVSDDSSTARVLVTGRCTGL